MLDFLVKNMDIHWYNEAVNKLRFFAVFLKAMYIVLECCICSRKFTWILHRFCIIQLILFTEYIFDFATVIGQIGSGFGLHVITSSELQFSRSASQIFDIGYMFSALLQVLCVSFPPASCRAVDGTARFLLIYTTSIIFQYPKDFSTLQCTITPNSIYH